MFLQPLIVIRFEVKAKINHRIPDKQKSTLMKVHVK
jgi:hypothetical protein